MREGAQFCTRCGARTVSGRDALNESVPTVGHEETGGGAETVVEGDPLVGRVLDGKYEIFSRLGAGGMGAVYIARRVLIGDDVALKVLHTKFVNDETLVERFRREARAAAQLHHPNVVTIHDYGETRGKDGFAYIVMELVRGESLRDLLRREVKFDATRAVSIMRDVCAGVAAAHRRGIVHRDIKPDNVIVVPPDEDSATERVKVVDFGIAKLRDMAADNTLTEAGAMVGTPFYMSPEQCKGEHLDVRADVYSLGALLYEMLAGQPPFNAPTLTGIIIKHITAPPPPIPQNLRVPQALQAAITRALSKEPEGRQADAAEFSREIQSALSTATTGDARAYTEPVFPATTQPAPVTPTHPTPTPPASSSATPPNVTNAPPSQTNPQATPPPYAANTGAAGQPAQTQRGPQAHQQMFPPQPYPPQAAPPYPTPLAQPRRKSRAGLVVGLLILLIVGLGGLAILGVMFLGNSGGRQSKVNVNARPTPAPTVANTNASNANTFATPVVPATDAMQRAEQKILSDTLLAEEDLETLTPTQLRILRNVVYARYGRVFQAPELQLYFQTRPWYHPRADFDERMLTENDSANANFVKTYEERGATPPPDTATVAKEVGDTLNAWAAATTERNLEEHMSFYADTLETYYKKQNVPATQVRADRARAFTQYDTLDVTLTNVQIKHDPTGTRAVVTLDKAWNFESDTKHSTGSVQQQLTLVKIGARWLINGEKDLQIYFTNNEEY
jgi:serine/threonine protein kinase